MSSGFLRGFLRRAGDFLLNGIYSRLDRLHEGLDNQSTDVNIRLDRLQESLANQSADINIRLDRLHRALVQSNISSRPAGASNRVEPGDVSRYGGSAGNANLVADIKIIEPFSHDWDANAASYVRSLDELRFAAKRLLPMVSVSANRQNLSGESKERLLKIESEIACLARQPLFFPEMFHGVKLNPDGSFMSLPIFEQVHLRANGLLGIEDRIGVRTVYERLLEDRGAGLRVVEIGSAGGRGSTQIGGELLKQNDGTLYCVDPWDYGMYFVFLANMRIFDLETTVFPIRSPSVEAAALFEDESLDAVFVDGSHIYPDVLADIDAYLPKIRKGGIMFGHDLHDVPSRFDRNELLSVASENKTDVNYRNPNGEVTRTEVHPGVILAVQDRFGDDVEVLPGSVVWAKRV